VNPGGPGGPGRGLVTVADQIVAPDVLARFPRNVRAVIIDGNVDPDQRSNHRLANKFERAGGFELVLSAFLSECDKAGANCAFAGNARVRFDALRDRLRQGPAEVPELGGTVTIDDLTDFITGAMYDVASWPDTAATLQVAYAAILGGGSAPPALAARPFPKAEPRPGWSPDDYLYNSTDSSLAVNCTDAPLPRDPALYPGIAVAFEKASPTFGRAEALGEVACANWPRTTERYHGPWNRQTAKTVLVVNPTYDPATRYDLAKRMTAEPGNARLLTLDGYGHTTRYSACITGWYSRYLIDGGLPPAGTRCQQDLPPFPAVP
jgi:hypothetical protein